MTGLIEGRIIFVMTLFLYLWIIIYQLGVIAVKKFLKKIFMYCALCVIRIEFKALYHVYITIKINVRLMFLSNKNSLACLCCYLTPLFTHRYHMQSTFSHLYLKQLLTPKMMEIIMSMIVKRVFCKLCFPVNIHQTFCIVATVEQFSSFSMEKFTFLQS